MAEISTKTAQIMTIAGIIDCLTAIGIMIYIFLGYSTLPIFIPILLLVTGIMIIFVSLSFHTKK